MAANEYEQHMKTQGLSPGFTQDDLKKALRKAQRTAHPDFGGSHDAMVKVNLAGQSLRKSAKPNGTPAPSAPSAKTTTPTAQPAAKPTATPGPSKPTFTPPPRPKATTPPRPAASSGSLTLSTGTPPKATGTPRTTQAAPASKPRPTRPETTRIVAPQPTNKPKIKRKDKPAASGGEYPKTYSQIHDSIFQKKSSLSSAQQKTARRSR